MFKKILFILVFCAFPNLAQSAEKVKILNVSYDPTRELFKEYNQLFKNYWRAKTGQEIIIYGSHGGSGKQARSVIDGLKADVVTLALAYDIDKISEHTQMVNKNWQRRLKYNSSPYRSTIVFLVRKGNPLKIRDWIDLARPGVKVITPNPKTSGGARWNYLAAYGYGLKRYGHNERKARNFIKKILLNIPVLDAGARGSVTTFAKRGIGDVLISWENEAYLAMDRLGKENFEIIHPSISILAEPPVAVIDKIVDKKNTREVSTQYLKYLYSYKAQKIIAKHYYRPVNTKIAQQNSHLFKKMKLMTIKDFGGWKAAQMKHFDDGGTFDRIYQTISKRF